MKKLRYDEPHPTKGNVSITLTREEAIQKQKLYAEVFHQARYRTDEHALQEFIEFNDAYWVDDESQ